MIIFVIGDAHRTKLERTLKAAGMEVSNDVAWLNRQKELNTDAAQGLSARQREGVDRVISSAKDGIAKTNLENNVFFNSPVRECCIHRLGLSKH